MKKIIILLNGLLFITSGTATIVSVVMSVINISKSIDISLWIAIVLMAILFFYNLKGLTNKNDNSFLLTINGILGTIVAVMGFAAITTEHHDNVPIHILFGLILIVIFFFGNFYYLLNDE